MASRLFVVARDLIAEMPFHESSRHQEALDPDWRGPDSIARMAFDWEYVLGTGGEGLATAHDQTSADELYRDHPEAVSPAASVDPGDEPDMLPFNEV